MLSRDTHTISESEQSFRMLVENLSDFIFRLDRDNRLSFVNPAFERTFAVQAKEVLGKTLKELPQLAELEQNEALMTPLRNSFEQCTASESELRWNTAQGERIFEVRHSPEKDATGKVVSVISIARDISAQKQAERERLIHTLFLENMDRINRAIQANVDLDSMMSEVLGEVLEIFDCDRASLVYPCDPAAASWTVPMERTRPEFPGVMAIGKEMPMTAEIAAMQEVSLKSALPVAFGVGTNYPISAEIQAFGDKSGVGMALNPKTGKAWGFSITQCSHARQWTAQELRLFEAIGRRLTDGLSSFLFMRESRERERQLLEAQRIGQIGNWWHDLQTGEMFWSDELFNILGIQPQQPSLELELSLIHPADRPRLHQGMLEALADETQGEEEFRIIRSEGEIRWIHHRWIRLLDETGQEIKRVGTYHDISELKQAEQDKLDSELRMNRFISNLQAFFFTFRKNDQGSYCFPYASPGIKNIYGLDPRDVREDMAPLHRLAHPDDRAKIEAAILQSSATLEPIIFESRVCRPDKPVRWIFVRSVPEKDVDGSLIWYGVMMDITERKQADQQLSLLNFALNNSQEETILVDQNSRILYANDQACKALKYTREELLRLSLSDIDSAHPAEQWPSTWDRINQHKSIRSEGVHRAADGAEYPVDISASYFEYEGQGYLLGMTRDISEGKKAEQEMLRINRFLRTLSSCNETLVHARDEQKLLQAMCRVVVEVGEFALAWVGLLDPAGDLRIQAQFGAESDNLMNPAGHIESNDSDQSCRPALRAIQTGAIQVVQDSASDSCVPWRNQAMQLGYHSAIALPISNAEEVIGVLSIYSEEQASFGHEETALLSELASDLSYGIYSLRTRLDRERFVSQLQASMESTIQALASTVDLRDPYTAGHQRRVARLAVAIAREAGLTEEQVQVVNLTGLIHDIGKIAIPAEILSKPGRLSDIEMALVRSHAMAGYDILKNVDFPWPIAKIVRQHHERFDGSGYPDGLKGDDILIEARILAIADVVEAMTTHRPYRPGFGIDAALQELLAGRGIHYDAHIVDICVKICRDQGFKFDG